MIAATGFWTVIFGYIVAFTATMFIMSIVIAFYYDRKSDYEINTQKRKDESFAKRNRVGK